MKKEIKDTRFTMRLSEKVYKKLITIADNSNRSMSGTIDTLLRDAIGIRGQFPCIIKTGSECMFISPVGNYGVLDTQTFKRFLAGGLPMEKGDRWDELYDSMEEACNNLGTEICRQAYNGLVISDYMAFAELLTKHKIVAQS